jgi:hypothetical protein
MTKKERIEAVRDDITAYVELSSNGDSVLIDGYVTLDELKALVKAMSDE